MAKSINHKFYTSKRWEDVAAAYRKYCGGLCARCKARGIYRPADIVHHKTHLTAENVNDPSIAYNFNNLECVCIECHNKIHFGEKKERRRYKIDNCGNLII